MAERDQLCGISSFHPPWLQKLASAKIYLIVFSILGAIQGMSNVYTTATLSTLEKRFKFPSYITGLVKTGNEVSEIMLCLVLTYWGGRGNRPRWLAWGVVICAAASYLVVLPHWLYGPGQEAIALSQEHLDLHLLNNSTPSKRKTALLCQANMTSSGKCVVEESTSGQFSFTPIIIIFLSQFMLGIGSTLNRTLGQTYMDDNTKKKNTPFMLGVIMSMAMAGPALGFMFTSFCLRLYIEPTLTPTISRRDPRWLGAWWLGWIVLGTMNLVVAVLMAFFPRDLPRNKTNCQAKSLHSDTLSPEQEPLSPTSDPSMKQDVQDSFFRSLLRLFRNKILMYNILSSNMLFLGAFGYWVYMVKYTETQYHMSASRASMVSGTTYMLGTVVGTCGYGLLMSILKPRAKYSLAWNVFVGFVNVAGTISFIFLGCKDNGIYGLDTSTGKIEILNDCNDKCGCQDMKYQPVCFTERNITFFSPCHIGCLSNRLSANGSRLHFSNCSCIPDLWHNTSLHYSTGGNSSTETYLDGTGVIIANGPCPVDCTKMFYTFLLIIFCVKVLVSSGRVTNAVVNFRCVDHKDKTFAQGLSMLLISLFSFLPAPIVYGAIIDSTCLVWDSSCGPKGNCWIYDKEKFRLYFNIMAVVAQLISTLVDIKLFFLAKHLNLYDDSISSNELEGKPKSTGNIMLHVRN